MGFYCVLASFFEIISCNARVYVQASCSQSFAGLLQVIVEVLAVSDQWL